MGILHIRRGNAVLVMKCPEERGSPLIKIVSFIAIILISVCVGVSLAPALKLKQGGSELCFSCHEEKRVDFNKKYIHSPVKQDNCIDCHNPHAAKNEFMLSKGTPELCYSCHTDEMESFSQSSHVHTAVEQGNCAGCHDPHASDNEYLQKEIGEELCYSCHKKEAEDFRNGEIHAPVEAGECFACHRSHVSDFRSLLVDSTEQLCFTCHDRQDEEFKRVHRQYPIDKSDCLSCHAAHSSLIKDPALADMAKGLALPYVHKPFGKKMCDSCHSDNLPDPIRLRAAQTELCYRCHSEMKKTVSSQAYSHFPVNDGRCVSCHAPHASKYEHLVVTTGKELCANCHPDLMKKLEATHAHNPAVQGECLECHRPHAAEESSLLVDDSISVCESCHEEQVKFTHPVGEGAVDPRTKESVTCATCHDAHGSEHEFVLVASRQRDLCLQCHKM